MQMLNHGRFAADARRRLLDVLGRPEAIEPDDTGLWEVTVEAGSHEAALQRVFDAIAAAGADDHVAIAEHPALPEHWRRRAAAPLS
jgi:hypothetical protein